MKVAILGAGISGLSVAWKLTEAGVEVDVFEAMSQVGGLAGTSRENGFCLDYGPHSFFSDDEEIRQTVLDLFDGKLEGKERTVEFCYQGKYLDYPLSPKNLLLEMGWFSSVQTAFSYLLSRFNPNIKKSETDYKNVEEWAEGSFGPHLYKAFFKPYTEQFWKIPCTELSPRAIPTHTRMSFVNTLKVIFGGKATQKGESLIERETLPTYYPKTGYGEISEKVEEKVRGYGGSIHLSTPVRTVVKRSDGKFDIHVYEKGIEEVYVADRVISTLPLDIFSEMLKPVAPMNVLERAKKLDYRGLLTLSLITSKEKILSSSYVYMLDRPYNRLTDMNQFSSRTSPEGKNILMLEIPTIKGGSDWQATKEELFTRCIESLEADGILNRDEVEGVYLKKTPNAYPVYSVNYQEHLEVVMNHIHSIEGLHTLGRTGEFMYMDIDRCMRRAFSLCETIERKANELEAILEQ